MAEPMCACGLPLHYSDPAKQHSVQLLVDRLGPDVTIQVAGTAHAWRVPRHFIALHGLAAASVDDLAAQYGWASV
jgi:hypothetical protein